MFTVCLRIDVTTGTTHGLKSFEFFFNICGIKFKFKNISFAFLNNLRLFKKFKTF